MAILKNPVLFFTTSPRTPEKMIPEIRLLTERFEGKPWNTESQEMFIDLLAEAEFFHGKGSDKDKALSARDRINRGPKALGFVDLKPVVRLTAPGVAFVRGKRPQEIFLRQLLKFQLPSPYHKETEKTAGTFYVRPYLEILRLIRELGYLTFDELKLFGMQLTDYREFDDIVDKIIDFRGEKEKRKGQYKKFLEEKTLRELPEVYARRIASGETKTRESMDASLDKFIATQKSNWRDYADACFRYLRYTGLVSISHKNKSISFFPERLKEVDFILQNVPREPGHFADEAAYKEYLFNPSLPVLYTDDRANLMETLSAFGFTAPELRGKSLETLKDLRDEYVKRRKETLVEKEIEDLKSYKLYQEIRETYQGIVKKEYYDAPLMFEYNTWRAMTMLDGGDIHGNFNTDDFGQPLSTAAGNQADIVCDYGDYDMVVEVTLQSGQKQYETEGEPVARHRGQHCKEAKKDTYCLFIAPKVNEAAFTHFFFLNQIPSPYYGGKSKIIPLSLEQFSELLARAAQSKTRPTPAELKKFLDSAMDESVIAKGQEEWAKHIQQSIDGWLAG